VISLVVGVPLAQPDCMQRFLPIAPGRVVPASCLHGSRFRDIKAAPQPESAECGS